MRTVHYVLSTHWDREWYQTFQDYRARLVALLDRTIDDIVAGKLRGPFTTDGQSIVLEDYLEIRPHRREVVKKLLAEGKLVAGPWYVLPDEWLVSGEAMIRNLRLGRDLARKMGGRPSNAGFVCDLFGHISQLPQIFRGFGIDAGLIWRGIEPRPHAHFNWRGADGTTLLVYRFGRTGYCDYTFDVRHSHRHARPFDRAAAMEDLTKFLEKEAARAGAVEPILLFDGGDHLEYDADHYALLMELAEKKEFPFRIVHSTLDAYLAEVRRCADRVTQTVEGELRHPAAAPPSVDQQWLIPGVLSSRPWIKQANAECQSLLTDVAEPLCAMARSFLGREGAEDFLSVAWKWLLQNHPHDSICGCSIDAVHEDMAYRFAQCRQIARRQATDAARAIAAAVEGDVAADELRVVVFNPLPRDLDEIVDLTLQIPSDWSTFNEFFGFEPKPAFRVFMPDGEEIAYQRLSQAMNRLKTRIFPTKYPQTYRTNDVTIALPLKLPAMGYATLVVRRGRQDEKGTWDDAPTLPTRHRARPGLATSERSMENEHLAARIEPNGTITLADKRTGQTYDRLLTFEDGADIGDGWYHGQALADQVFVSSGCAADVSLVHDGPLLCCFRVRTTLRLPAEFQANRGARSDRFVDLVIDSRVTLRRGADRLEVETVVNNTARDHRLRVLFPTGASVESYLADGAFDVIERAIRLPDDHRWRELAVETTPQQSWVAVGDEVRGLAIIAPGQFESAVRDLPDRPIAITLLRAFGRTVMTDGEPGGQVPGEMKFRYWIVPGPRPVDRTAMCELGTELAAGVQVVQLRAEDVALCRRDGKRLHPAASFFTLEGDLVLSNVRWVDGAYEVRLFNPSERRAVARLRPAFVPQSVGRVDFESRAISPASSAERETEIHLDAKQIATVRFTPRP